MQCRGPMWVAEGAQQGHEIRALTADSWSCAHVRRSLLSPWQQLWSVAPEDVLHMSTATPACQMYKKGTPS